LLKKYEITATYKISQSLWLIKWLAILHGLSFIAVFLTSVALVYKALLWCTIIFSLFFCLDRENRFNGLVIRYSSFKGWEFADLEDIYSPIEVLPSTVITPYFLIMHFNQQNRQKQTILICKDALINDDYRKLMVALRISGLKRDGL